jgi:hypothetical protein
MKAKLLELLKKYWKYAVLIIVILLLSVRSCVRDAVIKSQTKKITTLEMANFGLNNDRDKLNILFNQLQRDYFFIERRNDSLKTVLKKYQTELINLKKEHAKEIEELLKIPNDTIYVRLQPLFNNYDNTPLQYPFSGSQIRQIYSGAISYGQVQQEYVLQGKSLNACLNLNDSFEIGIANLNKQVTTLQENIGKSDQQIVNYTKEVSLLNKQVNRKSFWNKLLLITAGITTGIAILK